MIKKSIILALGTMILAMGSQVALANAPTFGNIPDVIIGDADFNAGLTVDLNFFNYVNALNLMKLVNDDDTGYANLRAAFQEQTTDANDLNINGKLQLGPTQNTLDRDTWTGNELTNGGTEWWLSFRDIVRSPTGRPQGDPIKVAPFNAFNDPKRADGTDDLTNVTEALPWHNVQGSPGTLTDGTFGTPGWRARTMMLWVADEDNSVSEGLMVYSVNNAANSLSGAFTTLFGNDFSAAGQTPWGYSVISPTYGQCTSSGGMTGGYLGIESGLAAGAALGNVFYGRWQSLTKADGYTQVIDAIPAGQDEIYQARYRMTLKQNAHGGPATKDMAPTFRVGVANAGANATLDVFINAAPFQAGGDVNTQLPAVDATKDYNIFWSPMNDTPNWQLLGDPALGGIDLRTWYAYFDFVDSDNAKEGKWQLEDYVVGRIARPASLAVTEPASVRYLVTDLTSTTGGFTKSGDGSTFVQMLQNNPTAGKVKIQDRGLNTGVTPNGDTYLIWQRANTVVWNAEKLVRATVYLSCPTNADRANYHKTRFRHEIGYSNMISILSVNQSFATLPGVPGTDLNPGCPISEQGQPAGAMTAYEVYASSFDAGPGGVLVGSGFENWTLGIDQVHNKGAANQLLPTNVVVHQVLYELLEDPAGA